MKELFKWMIISGAVLAVLGLVGYFASDKLKWFGKLPGDIRVENDRFSFYFPITTMVVLSVVLSLAMWLWNKIGGR